MFTGGTRCTAPVTRSEPGRRHRLQIRDPGAVHGHHVMTRSGAATAREVPGGRVHGHLAGWVLGVRDVDGGVAGEEAEGFEGEAAVLDGHDGEVLDAHQVGHSEAVPGDWVRVRQGGILWDHKEGREFGEGMWGVLAGGDESKHRNHGV